MSQAGMTGNKEVFGSRNKVKYEPYTDEELESDEFFWNQLNTIVYLKNKEYLYYFLGKISDHIEKELGM